MLTFTQYNAVESSTSSCDRRIRRRPSQHTFTQQSRDASLVSFMTMVWDKYFSLRSSRCPRQEDSVTSAGSKRRAQHVFTGLSAVVQRFLAVFIFLFWFVQYGLSADINRPARPVSSRTPAYRNMRKYHADPYGDSSIFIYVCDYATCSRSSETPWIHSI